MPKLTNEVLTELERILDNKPVRPVRVSTLAQRWQELAAQGIIDDDEEEVG